MTAKTKNYVLYYVATQPNGIISTGNVYCSSNGIQGMDWLRSLERLALEKLISQGDVLSGTKLVATGWQEFVEEPRMEPVTDIEKLGQILKEDGQYRYYGKDRVFVMRMTEDALGDMVPCWCYERDTHP